MGIRRVPSVLYYLTTYGLRPTGFRLGGRMAAVERGRGAAQSLQSNDTSRLSQRGLGIVRDSIVAIRRETPRAYTAFANTHAEADFVPSTRLKTDQRRGRAHSVEAA